MLKRYLKLFKNGLMCYFSLLEYTISFYNNISTAIQINQIGRKYNVIFTRYR